MQIIGCEGPRYVNPSRYAPTVPLKPNTPITRLPDNAIFNMAANTITYGTVHYTDVKILLEDWLKDYPNTAYLPTDNEYYQSEYMKLMIKVIKQENISAENPPKAEVLTRIFTEEMRKANLPLSKRAASAMATLVRPVRAQGGKNKKG